MRLVRPLLALALASGLMIATAAAASARLPAGALGYDGTTSTGDPVSFDLVKTRTGVLRFRGWTIFPTLTCDDATVVTNHGFGYGFLPGERLDGRTLNDVNDDELDVRWTIQGRFRNHQASGTLEFELAAFTAAGEPQSCSTGPVTWTAERTFPG